MSLAALGRVVHLSGDHLGKIEKAERWPTADVVRRCDKVLQTGEELARLWPEVDAQRQLDAQRRLDMATPAVTGPVLSNHWHDLLRVLAVTDNAMGVGGLLDVVHNEIMLIDQHRRAAQGRVRDQLAGVMARWLEFGSWIADNEQQPDVAGRWLQTAGSLAGEVGDTTQSAYVLMRRAQRAVEAGDAVAATALAEPVLRDSMIPPRVRALAAVRHAQALAHQRDGAGVRAVLGKAYHLVDQAAHSEEPAVTAMASHGTSAYLRGYEALCRLLLDEPDAAVHDLRLLLAEWPPTQRLDEGLFRAYLAVALDRAGQRDAAHAEAVSAKCLAMQTGSRRTLSVLDGQVSPDGAQLPCADVPHPMTIPARPTGMLS